MKPPCRWCRTPIPPARRRDAEFCSKACRQWAFRLRRRRETADRNDRPLHFAYADPPYPGTAQRYYGDEEDFAGEVDHRRLLLELEGRRSIGELDGWALSTSVRALRAVLPLCPEMARVCAWVKPNGVPSSSHGLHNAWEALIVVGGRRRPPGRRDWLSAKPARLGGELTGRKPIAFCAWLFDCLGMLAGDTLEDLFPGTGVVARAWSELSREASAAADDASQAAAGDTSPTPAGDESSRTSRDTSPRARDDASSQVLAVNGRIARLRFLRFGPRFSPQNRGRNA